MALATASTMANSTRAQLSSDSLSYFPNNNSQLITPQDLRDWLTNGIESFVTQKDKSTFENAFYECRGSAITATSGTTNLALAGGNFVHITGTPPPPAINITSFGTLPPGSRFVLCFDIAVTLVYNATTMILPGAANIVTAAGDCVMIISEGAGNWRLIGYFPSSGLPVGTVTAVTASAPLSSTGSNAPDISISQAGASTDGYLSSADWNTFDGKQDALTLTTSGTSGAATLIGSTLNIPQYSGGGGGTPGGADTELQYNNAGAFGGIPELTYSGGFVQIETPKIGTGNGNGHLHIHSANSAPTGITNYLTTWWEKATRVLGFRAETDTHETYIQLTAPTADRTLTLPDASGNVVVDTTVPSFSNGANAGEIRLKEAGGSDYIGIKAPNSVGTPITFTLPNTDGTSGTVLQTNGSGVLSWTNNGGATALQYLKNTAATTITNPAVNTIIETLLIPAGTFTLNNSFVANFKSNSTIATTAINLNFSINTSISLTGALQISGPHTLNAGTGAFNGVLGINLYGGLSGNTTRYLVSPWTNVASIGSSTTVIDWSVNQYLIMWCGASATRNMTNILIGTTPT